MARTIIAVFDSMFSAKKALAELEEYGVARDMIDVFSRPARSKMMDLPMDGKAKKVHMEVEVGGQGAGMRIGAGVGSAVGISGSMMAALGALPVPFLPMTTFEPLTGAAAALAIAAMAALAGGLLGLLLGGSLDTGIPEEELHQYARAVRSDEVVVAVLADWDAVDTVVQLIHRNAPLRVEERAYSRLRSPQVGAAPSTLKAQARALANARKREDQQ